MEGEGKGKQSSPPLQSYLDHFDQMFTIDSMDWITFHLVKPLLYCKFGNSEETSTSSTDPTTQVHNKCVEQNARKETHIIATRPTPLRKLWQFQTEAALSNSNCIAIKMYN